MARQRRRRQPTAHEPARPPLGLGPTVGRAIGNLALAAAGLVVLYGGWLCLEAHFSSELSGPTLAWILGCAFVAATIFALGARCEPSTPLILWTKANSQVGDKVPATAREMWETLPEDIVAGMLAAIGTMALGPVVLLVFGELIDGFAHFVLALGVVAGGFSLVRLWDRWRGRSLFDPPGWISPARKSDDAKPPA
jgi:hypothetical protein